MQKSTSDMPQNSRPTNEEFERLFVNNGDFERIQAYQTRFNPIKVMRMENMEIRHSAILAWLLDPQESHGLGDVFLKAFLAQACRDSFAQASPTALDISQANMMSAEVRVEWQQIDILIHSPRNKWVFLIENKFWSSQSQDQLKGYMEKAKLVFSDGYNIRGIFLALNDEDPDNSKATNEQDKFVSTRYDDIVNLLEQKILTGRYSFSSDVEMFLHHYLEILMTATDRSDERRELESLAKKLYLENKKAIDFIVEHGAMTDFAAAVDSVFEDVSKGDEVDVDGQGLVYFAHNKRQVSFLPVEWKNALNTEQNQPLKRGCENYWHGNPVICWFELNKIENEKQDSGKLILIAEIGPIAEASLRQALIAKIEALEPTTEPLKRKMIAFNARSKNDGAKYSKFFQSTTKSNRSGNSLVIADVTSSEEIASGMQELLKRFKEPIEKVAGALNDFGSNEGQEG